MKKLIFTTMAISALFLSVSCQKENVNDAPKGESVVFTAYVDGATPDSKTVIKKNEQGKTVSLWSGQERIWILNGTGTWKKAYVATVDSDSPADKAIFSEESSEVALSGNNYIAIYPAAPADGSWWNYGEGNYYVDKLWLKNTQTATAGSYDPSAHIALAHTNTNSLSFKNIVALLKFTAKSANVTSIKVTVGEGEALSGNFSCDPVNEKIATNHVEDYKYALHNNVELKGTFEAGKDYYIAVLPGTYSSLTVAVNGKVVKTKTSKLTFERNTVYEMIEVDAEYPVCEYGLVGSFNSWNTNEPYQLKDTNGDEIFEYKGIQIDNNTIFKFNSGDVWLSTVANNLSAGFWYNLHSKVNDEIKFAVEPGEYDIYYRVTEEGKFFCAVKTGEAMPAYKAQNIKLYLVVQDKTFDQYALYAWASEVEYFGGWPGLLSTNTRKIYDTNNHYWEMPTEAYGQTFTFIFNNNNNGLQTVNIEQSNPLIRDFAYWIGNESGGEGARKTAGELILY